jgi:glycosyltransferase involved in cell wall biosynthesis
MKFAIVTNIPSPFRLHLFNILYLNCKKRNIDLEIHFIGSPKDNRPADWTRLDAMPFICKTWRDFPIKTKIAFIHFNPGLLGYLFFKKPDILMIGGPWSSITTMLISILPFKMAKLKIAWLELNRNKISTYKGLFRQIKKYILKKYPYFAVPGNDGFLAIKEFINCNNSQIGILPNIIDETMFKPKWTLTEETRSAFKCRFTGDCRDSRFLGIIPARLSSEKGLIPFFKAISEIPKDLLAKWILLIAGSGPELINIEYQIKQQSLEKSIIIHSPYKYDEMPFVYASSDLFILPSLWDHNPLTVIEAMWVGLPILISSNVGNYFEALGTDTKNGWSFNPENNRSMVLAIQSAFSSSREDLGLRGVYSYEKAKKLWDSNKAINNFLNKLPIKSR